jgi:DNA-binding transcriptional MocR family regulator
MKLYEIAKSYSDFLSIADSEEFDPQTVADTLEAIAGEIEEKGRNVAAFHQNMEADIKAMKEAEARIAARRKTLEKKRDWLKDYLRENMERCGISKIECPEFVVRLTKPRDVCEVYAEDELDELYVKTKVTKSPDKAMILKALKDGYDVVGARIGKSKPGLTIK